MIQLAGNGVNQAHKVVISGTGRAGTTFLVRLLTECGLDTGFTRRTWRRDYHESCHAGLERDILTPWAPYIVKGPDLCERLPGILATGRFVIDHAIVPVRDLDSAAQSRIRIGGADGSRPGGLWKTADPAAQKAVLGEMFHRLMHTLAAHDIPFTLLLFPRLVTEPDYVYDKLGFLLRAVPRERFHRIFARVADPSLIHPFGSAPAPPPVSLPPVDVMERERRRYQARRRRRRFAVRTGIAVGLAVLLFCGWRVRDRVMDPAILARRAAALSRH